MQWHPVSRIVRRKNRNQSKKQTAGDNLERLKHLACRLRTDPQLWTLCRYHLLSANETGRLPDRRCRVLLVHSRQAGKRHKKVATGMPIGEIPLALVTILLLSQSLSLQGR